MTSAALTPVAANHRAADFSESGTVKRLASGTHRLVTHQPQNGIATTEPTGLGLRRNAGWLAAASAIAALAVFQVWKSWHSESAILDHSGETVRTVQVDHPTLATTTNVVLPATIRPWQTTTLVARVSGYLGVWHHDLGERVKAGDLLAEIETPELDQELAQGEALAREAQAGTVQAKAEREEAQADLKMAEAQLARVHADTELAKSLLVRREKLLANHTVTQEEYDTYLRQLEARNADLAAAKSDVVRRRANLQTRAATITVREATAHSRQSNVKRLKELQTFKRIVAPFDGVITKRAAEVGMLVTSGKESLFSLEDMSRVRVQMQVPQAHSVQTTAGVTALVTLPESTLPAVPGTITRIAQSVDSTNRTMLAEIELENSSYHFQPGSYAQVSLAMPAAGSAWTIPANTVSMQVDGPHVAVVNGQSQIEVRAVTLGRDLGARIVVSEGIRGNEQLVVNPSDSLTSGLRVQVSKPRSLATGVAQR